MMEYVCCQRHQASAADISQVRTIRTSGYALGPSRGLPWSETEWGKCLGRVQVSRRGW
jgi:hypothetical protein